MVVQVHGSWITFYDIRRTINNSNSTSRGTSSSSRTIIELHQIPFIFYFGEKKKKLMSSNRRFRIPQLRLNRLQRSFTFQSIKLQIHVLYCTSTCALSQCKSSTQCSFLMAQWPYDRPQKFNNLFTSLSWWYSEE